MISPRNPFPINDTSDFRAWKRQNSNAEKLLFRIIFRWRVSNARLRNQPGKWVANPIDFWAGEAHLSRDQTKRALATLELDRLIIRKRGWFAGSKVHSFLQPTLLALKHMGKPGDLGRLEASLGPIAAPIPAPNTALEVAPSIAPMGAPIAAPTITSLSLPSNPSKPTSLQKGAKSHSPACAGGKGKGAHKEKKTAQYPAPTKVKPVPMNIEDDEDLDDFKLPDWSLEDDPDELEWKQKQDAEDAERLANVKAITKNKKLKKDAKRAALLALLPKNPNAPDKIWHPSDQYAKWHTWSAEKLIEKQDQYDEYVSNSVSKSNSFGSKGFASILLKGLH
jgi:hypothetical protein